MINGWEIWTLLGMIGLDSWFEAVPLPQSNCCICLLDFLIPVTH